MWPFFLMDFLDHFELYLYVGLGSILAPLFVSGQDTLTQWCQYYGLYWGVSVLAYPLGAWLIGLWADRTGPRGALYYAALGLSLTTITMGFLPDGYGKLSLVLFVFTRFCQCVFARGQRSTTRLYILQAPQATQNLHRSVLYDVLTILGIWAASTISSIILPHPHYWRYPYIIAGMVGLMTCFFIPRLTQHNWSQHQEAASNTMLSWRSRLTLVMAAGCSYATYALVFQFLNGFLPLISDLTAAEVMRNNSHFMLVDLACIVSIGWIMRYFIQHHTGISCFLWLSKILMSLSLWLASGVFVLFSILFWWPHAGLFLIRSFVILLGCAYSLAYVLWLGYFRQYICHEYRHISLYGALGTIILGNSFSFLSFSLYKALPHPMVPGLYFGFLFILNAFLLYYFQKGYIQSKKSDL